MQGMQVASPFAVADGITMRAADHTIIGYPLAWGRTVPKLPFVENFSAPDWSEVIELEGQWKAGKGYV